MTLDKIIRIKVTGNNVNNYLKRIIKRKINFIKIIPITKKELDIILKYDEYLKLLEYKTILFLLAKTLWNKLEYHSNS